MNSVDEAMRDDLERSSAYDVDVACSDCGDAAIVRYVDGEPADEAAMTCHCGGEMVEV